MPAKRPLSSPDDTAEGRAKIMAGVQHSPKLLAGQNVDLLKSIESMMASQTQKINANVDDKIEGLKSTIELRLSEIENSLKMVQKENLDLKERNVVLEKRMSELEIVTGSGSLNSDRLLYLERSVRQRNIVATGIDFDTPQQGFEKLNQMIGAVTEGAIRVTGIRAFKPKTGKGIVVTECGSMENKQCIMRAKKQFVMTVGEETHPVYVDSDLPHQDRVVQSKLRAIAKEMRAQGKDVRLALGRLKVDREWRHYNLATNEVEAGSFRKET